MSQAQFAASQAQGLHGRVKSYAETLQKLNEADRSREKMSAVTALAAAAALDPDGTAVSSLCIACHFYKWCVLPAEAGKLLMHSAATNAGPSA